MTTTQEKLETPTSISGANTQATAPQTGGEQNTASIESQFETASKGLAELLGIDQENIRLIESVDEQGEPVRLAAAFGDNGRFLRLGDYYDARYKIMLADSVKIGGKELSILLPSVDDYKMLVNWAIANGEQEMLKDELWLLGGRRRHNVSRFALFGQVDEDEELRVGYGNTSDPKDPKYPGVMPFILL